MDFFTNFTAITFSAAVVILFCNILLFFILVICIPTISARIKRNTEVIEENSERIERYLHRINKNIIKINNNIEINRHVKATRSIDNDNIECLNDEQK